MKKFLALVLALVMTMSLVTVSASAKADFTDGDKITNEEAVEVLNAMGVLTGYADGSYRPQATLTRGAGAKIAAYLVLGQTAADKLTATYTVFEDVTDSVGLAAYIEWAAAAGIVDGYGDGNFGPYNTLTEYAFGKMLLTALGYNTKEEGYTGAGWQKNVYTDALAAGIYDGTETWGACTRDTAARMALGALTADVVVYGKVSNLWIGSNGNNLGTSTSSDFLAFVQKLLNKVGVISTEGVVKTGIQLWENYKGLSYAEAHDIFARPGHVWTYKTWDNFYMDAPVAEYTDKVEACDILVDLGIAKTSQADVKLETYINGDEDVTHARLGHNVCDIPLGGKGTLTQVFETADGEYRLTEVHTYLAKVTYADPAAHGYDLDESNILVYGWDRDETAAFCLNGVLLTKGDYVLIQHGVYGEGEGENDYYAGAEDYKGSFGDNHYTRVIGKAQSFEGKVTGYTPVDTLKLTVAGASYNTAAEYNHSYVFNNENSTGIEAGMKKTAVWFLDQYGNIIADFAPESAKPVYGVIDAIKWVNDGEVDAAQYASANLVKADATQGKIVAAYWNGNKLAGVGSEGVSFAVGKVSDVKALNSVYTDNGEANYGVVSYTVDSNNKYTLTTVGNKTGIKAITKGQALLGGFYVADDDTVFLVRTKDANGNYVYKQYVGYNNVPTMSGLTDIVCVNEVLGDYVNFAFVIADNAVYPGSSVEAYVLNMDYTYADGVYTYTGIYVDGKQTDIKSEKKYNELFVWDDCAYCGVAKVTFDANSYATSIGDVDGYKHNRTVTHVGNGVVMVDPYDSWATLNMNTTVAKVYLVNTTAGTLTEVAASTIAVGDTLCYSVDKTNTHVMTTVYIVDQADTQNPLA